MKTTIVKMHTNYRPEIEILKGMLGDGWRHIVEIDRHNFYDGKLTSTKDLLKDVNLIAVLQKENAVYYVFSGKNNGSAARLFGEKMELLTKKMTRLTRWISLEERENLRKIISQRNYSIVEEQIDGERRFVIRVD